MGDRNSSAIAAASLLAALAAPPAMPLVWLLSLATQPVCAQAVAPTPPTATASVGNTTAADSPVIDDIKFVGNTRVSVAQLRDVLKLKVGDIYSRAKMKTDLNRIIALYRIKGFDLSVSPDIAHAAVGHVTITIKFDESGPGGDTRATPPADATNTEPGGPPR